MALHQPVVFRNGNQLVNTPTFKASELVKAMPKGAYTTARTVNNKVLYFEAHVNRLYAWEAAHAIVYEGFEQFVFRQLRAALLRYLSVNSNSNDSSQNVDDMRITMILTQSCCEGNESSLLRELLSSPTIESQGIDSSVLEKHGLALFTYVERLPPTPQGTVAVDVIVAQRTDPTNKLTRWAQERTVFEQNMNRDSNEVLLRDSDGNLYEGLSSNFFVVDANGTVITAPEDFVLNGTIRRIAIQCCVKLGIPVAYELPNIANIDTWQGAFLTSTSRLLLPIDKFHILQYDSNGNPSDPPCYEDHIQSNSPVVFMLKQAVAQQLDDMATPIL